MADVPWVLRLELPWPPTTNNRLTSLVVRSKSDGVPRARAVLSKQMREYLKDAHDKAWAQVQQAGLGWVLPTAGLVGVRFKFFRPRLEGDISNRQKAVEDALKGVVYVDDALIEEYQATRALDRENARVELTVWPIL